jgi:hypothetical protein
MKYWYFVESEHNWKQDKFNNFSHLGIDKKKFNLKKFSIDDKIVMHITGEKKVSDIRVIVDNSLHELPKTFNYDRPFEYCLKTKPIILLPKENWIPMDKFIYDLSIFKNRLATIGLVFFHAPLQLTKEDFDFMLNLMK